MATEVKIAIQKFLHWQYFPVIVLILGNVIIGSLIVQDYGISWDEPSRYQVAEKSLLSYLGEVKDRRGSFYLAFSRAGSILFHQLNNRWSGFDAWHFVNFFFYYQLIVLFFYMICLRMAHKWVAFAATILFITQPLLWGHAFINPKDIPFTAFFTASFALGLRMVEMFPSRIDEDIDRPILEHMRQSGLQSRLISDWIKLGEKKQKLIKKVLLVTLGLFVFVLLATPLAHAVLKAVVQQAYSAGQGTFLGDTFRKYAQNASAFPVEEYIRKASSLYSCGFLYYTMLTLFVSLITAIPFLPGVLDWIWRRQLGSWIRVFGISFKSAGVWGMGLFMGLADSIRAIGLFAGLMIGLYFLIKRGRKAYPVLLACFLIAAMVNYLCWPGIWGSTPNVNRIYTKTTNFSWQSAVLFNGVDYMAQELPLSYLPTLLSLQFSEPPLLLFLIGISGVVFTSIKYKKVLALPLVVVLWLFVPIIAVFVIRPTIYDNFRHLLFMTPAIFLFACLGMQFLVEKIRGKIVSVLLLIVMLLPSIYWDVKLHPFQYLYYNQLVGGVGGAFRRFELDYWTISYYDAMEYVNRVAPPGSKIYVWGPLRIGLYYGRDDLVFIKREKTPTTQTVDYAVLSTRHDKDLKMYPDARVVYQVERDGATFAVVKKLSP